MTSGPAPTEIGVILVIVTLFPTFNVVPIRIYRKG